MESIEKYVENFKKRKKMNMNYTMRGEELFAVAKEAEKDTFHTIVSVFDFGYAKGYRAAMAEMKKGGSV